MSEQIPDPPAATRQAEAWAVSWVIFGASALIAAGIASDVKYLLGPGFGGLFGAIWPIVMSTDLAPHLRERARGWHRRNGVHLLIAGVALVVGAGLYRLLF